MEQNVSSSADAESTRPFNLEVVQQGHDVGRGIRVAEGFGQCPGSAVAAHIRNDELELLLPFRDQRREVLTGPGKAVQQQERFAGAVDFEVKFDAIDLFDHYFPRPCRSISDNAGITLSPGPLSERRVAMP